MKKIKLIADIILSAIPTNKRYTITEISHFVEFYGYKIEMSEISCAVWCLYDDCKLDRVYHKNKVCWVKRR